MRVLLFLLFAFSVAAEASERDFFLDVGRGEKVFLRHKPAAKGSPTFVLLNGLTYSTRDWDAFTASLERRAPKAGILRYDMRGMGKTLLEGRLPVNYAITVEDQVELLRKILGKLKLKRVELIGLSYGGGIAIAFAKAHPEFVDQLFLLAPFTEALEAQDKWIRAQIRATRLSFPLNPATDEELYEYFLRQFIYSTYPTAEPSILDNPYKLEAVYRMVSGIRKFQAAKIAKDLPARSVHLMVANQDQYIPSEVMDRFWKAVPATSRASRINISYTEHKLPEAIPAFSAAWIAEALVNPALNGGKTFTGDAQRFLARSGQTEIKLPNE